MKSFCSNRRAFLKGALGGVAGLSIASTSGGAESTSSGIHTTEVAENLYLLTGAGANVVARTGSDGVLLVDGGSAEHAAALAQAVAALPGGRPVRTLFNTHWHPEQTGSNLALGRSGATIIAHEATRLWLTTDVTRPGKDKTYRRLPQEALPNKTFLEKDALRVDDEIIEFGHLAGAHTAGDIYVFFPKTNVLAIGDVISGNGWPVVDWWTGGWIEGAAKALEALLKVANWETRVIAAQGPMMTRSDLESMQKMFATISQRLWTARIAGKNVDDALAMQPTREFNHRMGDPTQFLRSSFQSMWGHVTPHA
jgi:glyoxylase-like metal-dependent hydrolase (beta-lactamase superfamily II)